MPTLTRDFRHTFKRGDIVSFAADMIQLWREQNNNWYSNHGLNPHDEFEILSINYTLGVDSFKVRCLRNNVEIIMLAHYWELAGPAENRVLTKIHYLDERFKNRKKKS